ncbi:succinate dehydrogenase/fumarate reductase flavoprotein subunit [Paenibacillus rhizosphaerae]|uniref:Succinate dehydrogenase/fumarate reductase flavoprotein subunit n=1 Tax=Paenibacillus rhizosphaerae TaxID=297318 RepID=A0A839TQ81_9BACL|nr:succinate dehydrogenase/fumarate reductase flavoprotein subunit [Paenibacillus rhizosphaerae]
MQIRRKLGDPFDDASAEDDRFRHVAVHRKEMPQQAVVEKKLKLQKVMLRQVGMKRDAAGLQRGLDELKRQPAFFEYALMKREEYEFANLLICAMLTTKAALLRRESRGGHFRVDFPQRSDAWVKHIVYRLGRKAIWWSVFKMLKINSERLKPSFPEWLEEDIGYGDITTTTIVPVDRRMTLNK